MPCDTRYETSALDVSKFTDSKRLRATLKDLGWSIRDDIIGTGFDAWRGTASIRVNAKGASVTTSNYSQAPSQLVAEITRGYAQRTVQDVSARFGFKLVSTQKQTNGSVRMLLQKGGR